jgi:hypothetical protein
LKTQIGGQVNPRLVFIVLIRRVFFSSVFADLKGVSKVQVQDMEWLAQGEFRVRVETLLTAFKAAGGEVDYKAS